MYLRIVVFLPSLKILHRWTLWAIWPLMGIMGIYSTSWAQTPSQILKTEKLTRQKTIQLFNGKNLQGWYTFLKKQGRNSDPDHVFTVKDKQIHILGSEFGCITTNDEYQNYDLEVEYKWGSKTFEPRLHAARDNGVLIHSQGQDGAFQGNWMYSLECQIIEGGSGDFLVVGDGTDRFSMTSPVAPDKSAGAYIYEPTGAPVTIHSGRINWFARDPAWKDVKDFRGAQDVEKPVGSWNTMRILAMGDDIYLYLNGVLVNRAMRVKPTVGRIQIQSEGAEMFVRKVALTPLSKK